MIDADEIIPGLWQGALPPPGELLSLLGYHGVVLAAEELQLPASMFPGVSVIHAPNNDDGSPLTREQLGIALTAAQQVARRIRDGQKVLSSCAQGVNRSGLVSALTLHFLHGWDGDRCIRQVRAKRRLEGHRRALSNTFFTEALRRLPARTV